MPFDYAKQMFLDRFNMQPFAVKEGGQDSSIHRRYLYTKLMSYYKFVIPKDWAMNYFRYFLFECGSIGVIYTKKFGWICNPYGILKVNHYYQPKEITVYNSFLDSEKRGIIGVNAGIIHLMDDYCGLNDIVNKYAAMMANVDKSFNINLQNANMAVAGYASNKKEAADLKAAYQDASEGKPLVVMNRGLMQKNGNFELLFPSPKNNMIFLELLEARRNITNQFLTEVGIPNANLTKKAQMTDEEITENDQETECIVSIILENIQSDMEEINRISGLHLTVEPRFNQKSMRKENADGKDNP